MQVVVGKSGTAALWVIGSALVVQLMIDHVWPWAYFEIKKRRFAELMIECDQAMHVHSDASAKARMTENPDDLGLKAAEVRLTVCHEYDILRKELLIQGVKEESLSLLGLRAMERRGVPLQDMIAPHVMPRADGAP